MSQLNVYVLMIQHLSVSEILYIDFYGSPFYSRYRDKALNELIRAGTMVDA